MNCPKCGAPIRDGARFCPRCGEPIPAPGAETPSAPQSPYAPAQRTADRVFPSQQRMAQQAMGAQAPNAAPSFHPAQQPGAPLSAQQPGTYYPPAQPAQPYGGVRQGPAQPGGIDWEHFQPRTSPKSANAVIWGAAAVVFAVLVMVWTLLIH